MRITFGRRGARAPVLVGLAFVGVLLGTGAVLAATPEPDSVSFTLEGCRNDGTIKLPNAGGKFVCPDAAYTTGNLGKGWNELDLVPYRITAKAGNAAPATQTYAISIALDNYDAGAPGYDVLGSDGAGGAPVLNTALSDASCTALTSTAQLTKDPGVGGIDKTIYRILEITQDKNTTCVYDWYGRLALGSHLFPGSSLHANLLNQNLGTQGIGAKDVSIPVKEILPQELSKDMSAEQDADHTWNITKAPTPASLTFGDTCSTTPSDLQQGVKIKVEWTKGAPTPSGQILVTTNIYATNPASRTITVNVTDKIYGNPGSGEVLLDTKVADPFDVPANTKLLVLTHEKYVAAGTTGLRDVATATYTDEATGVEVPGQTEATASADVTFSGTYLNDTAVITDTESITGTNFLFSADSFTPDIGDFDTYTAGAKTTGPVDWTSDTQSGAGSVEFSKTVYVTKPSVSNGKLSDTATVTGSDAFSKSADAAVDIKSSALVDLTINKSITAGVLSGSETENFVFDITGPDGYTKQVTLTFAAGDTSKSVTISDLMPGTYKVTEQAETYWSTEAPKSVTLDPATNGYTDCAGSVNFSNTFNPKLTVSKDAKATYDETHTWKISKSATPASQSGFAGDTLPWTWKVNVSEESKDSNFAVTGTITVTNPMPYAVTVDVADSLDDGTAATVVCDDADKGTKLTIAAGSSGTCAYLAAPTGKTATKNTATATLAGNDFSGSAAVSFVANVINGTAQLTDQQIGLDETLTAGQGPWLRDAADQHVCSTDSGDYTDGKYSDKETNLATVDPSDGEAVGATAEAAYSCYLWDVSKTANGTFNDQYKWDITKTVDPASQSGFAGDSLDWTWKITWSSSFEKEINHAVTGVITVTNPADKALTVDVSDYLWNGTEDAATVVCDDADKGTSLTVEAGKSGTCDYSAKLNSKLPNNTATATRNGVSVSDTVLVKWVKGADVGLDAVIKDSNHTTIPADSDQPYTYDGKHVCSTDGTKYTDGKYSGSADNTATITWTGGTDSSTASTSWDCYRPLISKTADTTTYDQYYEWDVDKTVKPAEQSGYPGDVLKWTWSVSVTKTALAADSPLVSGAITVTNPHPDTDMVVTLEDKLNDGTPATIYADADCAYDSATGILKVAKGATATCGYDAKPATIEAMKNVATATINGAGFTAKADLNWVRNDVNPDGVLTDDEIGLNEKLTGAGPWGPYTGSDQVMCSANRADYFKDGVYTPITDTIVNWAYVKSNGELQDKDDATTTWTCDAGFVDVLKTTNGVVNPKLDIRFDLYKGTTNLNDQVSTLGDEDGKLQFKTALIPGDTYTVCEAPVPAGYTFEITVDGGLVQTYAGPPGASNPTGEIQCFDFKAVDKTTLLFEVNNRYPGGAPRTPGYWKNWASCTTGGQAETAAKLGGMEAGVFILDDLLPQTVGKLEVTTCQVGVLVLDSRWAVNPKAGTQASSDSAYILARDYLAARLNQDAGACVPVGTYDVPGVGTGLTFEQVLTKAQELLVTVGYDGNDSLLTPALAKKAPKLTLRNQAIALSTLINAYNNSQLCTGEPSH